MAMNGADVLIRVNTGTEGSPVWTDVGAQRDATIDKTASMIDSSAKGDGDEKLIAGRRASNIQIDAIYVPDDTAYAKLLAAYKAGTKVQIRVKESGTDTEVADAFIENLSLSHPDQDVSTVSGTFRVSGGWSTV